MGVRGVCLLGSPCVLVGIRVVEAVCDRHRGGEGRQTQVVEAWVVLRHDEGHRSREVVCDRHRREENRRIQAEEACDDPQIDGAGNEVHPCQVHDRNQVYVPTLEVLEDVRGVACHGEVEEDICRLVEDDGESGAFLGGCDCLLVDRGYDSCRALGRGKAASGNEVS
jgi:hypothetical protein